MRRLPSLVLILTGCAAAPPREPPPPAPASTSGSAVPLPSTSTSTDASDTCIVIGARIVAEGVLHGSGNVLTLRLTRPRCVVGLPRAGFITEAAVATAGPDLRPLVDAHVRLEGDVIASQNDVGGPAAVLLAKSIERLVPAENEP